MTAIAVSDLRKTYGDHVGVGGVSFEVGSGEVYALLGHNGAGKSTIIEILEGHRQRTSGHVSVLGTDPGSAGREFRDRIGIVLQSSGIEPELTVREAVELYGSAYRRRRSAGDVIALVGLDERPDARVGTLSGGQRRRLDLALGIVGYPELLFLDEPTTGFDPAARRKAWELVAELRTAGTTVLLTTHYLDEAEVLADRVGVLAHGKLVAEGTPADLIGDRGVTTVAFDLPDPVLASSVLASSVLPSDVVVDGTRVSFTTRDATRDVHAVTSWAIANGAALDGLTVARPSLEEVFLQLAQADPLSDPEMQGDPA